MRIVARKTIMAFASENPKTRAALMHWLEIAEKATWSSTLEVVADFPKAKSLNGERVRFEVSGGNFRMIVAFHFRTQVAWIKFLGTHTEYDRIDAHTVDQF